VFKESPKDLAEITPISSETIRQTKGARLAALTAYDYPTARLLDEAGIDIILVGDSLGMVVLGLPDTTEVTLQDIVHHTRAAQRGVKRALLVADLPILTYETPERAVANARLLVEAGAHAVKLEGGSSRTAVIRAITDAGIPCMGHIGMLPQRIRIEGGYRLRGKTEEDRLFLLQEAKAVEQAGAFAVVLELIKGSVAGEITTTISIPTIGIGSGRETDGQILVFHDLVAYNPWFIPKHARPLATVGEAIEEAARAYASRVRSEAETGSA